MLFRCLLPFLFLLLGCSQDASSGDAWSKQGGQIKVLSTTTMIDDVVGKIGKDRISHAPLIQGEIDPHSYELVKGDDEKIILASIVFCNGLGLEHGASLRYHLQHHPNSIAVGDIIRERQPADILIRKGQLDPHVWMDISLWITIVDPIVEALSKVDPEGASYYETNAKELKNEMERLDREILDKLSKISPSKRYLVTSHDAFNYFTRRYLKEGEENWNVRFRAPEGLAPDGQLSCTDIQGIIDHLCQYHIPVVFSESNVSKDSLKKIVSACREKGLKVKIATKTLHADALGGPESGADTYLKMMESNVKVLLDEWE